MSSCIRSNVANALLGAAAVAIALVVTGCASAPAPSTTALQAHNVDLRYGGA